MKKRSVNDKWRFKMRLYTILGVVAFAILGFCLEVFF